MSRYAEGTSVPVEKTRIEIEEVLRRFGADAVSSGYDGLRAFVVFRFWCRMAAWPSGKPMDVAKAISECQSQDDYRKALYLLALREGVNLPGGGA